MGWLGKTLSRVSFPREMHLLCVSLVLANLGLGAEGVFMSVYVRDLGASYAQLGGVLSAASLSAGLLAVMGGWASDRYERVLMMSLGACVGGLAYAIKAVAPSEVACPAIHAR